MKYRDFLDLTDDEIRFIVNEIFKPVNIDNISRNSEWREITCEITTTWGNGTEEDPYEDIADELILKEKGIQIDFSTTGDDVIKWQKYLMAKGCHFLLKDNPYI